MIALNNARILLTGVTGFVGQAVLERLLSDHKDAEIWVLVRSRGEQAAQTRVDRLLRKGVFRKWRERVGADEAAEQFARRIHVLEGDLSHVPELPDNLDVVIHSASSVSFDLPIDEAFTHNVAGPRNLYAALAEAGGDPHVVHVSTSYVHGLWRGIGEEHALVHDVDWQTELREALEARDQAESSSRSAEALNKVLDEAHFAHRKAGPRVVAQAAEEARIANVRNHLVEMGRARANSLGWTDVYTFTKAMGERVAETQWQGAGHRLSVVRPTIIESALHHPYPGWIDGFKVADPLIAAYGSGMLEEFPALADSVLDIIPVDMVVNVILAAAQRPPSAGDANYYQVASGTSNPLPFGQLSRIVNEYFSDHPLRDAEGENVRVSTWTFPERGAVPRSMERKERAVRWADHALTVLPPGGLTRRWQRSLVKAERDLSRLRRFMELYQPYTQAELVFDDANVRALLGQLSDEERATHGFDVTEFDWETYLQDVHIPNVPGLSRPRRPHTTPRAVPNEKLPRRRDVLAVFDLHRTVATANILEHHLWVELERARAVGGMSATMKVASTGTELVRALRSDRGDFIRAALRSFRGADDAEIRELVRTRLHAALEANVLREAAERIAAHRAAGHHTLLITGGIDVFVVPIAHLFDHVEAGRAEVGEDGMWTGHLAENPLVGETRAVWLRRYAKEHGYDLAESYGYGDSYADSTWLAEVGYPHAVNPDAMLHRHALTHRWPVLSWTHTQENRVAPVRRALMRGVRQLGKRK